jgi:hypothetical protein
MRYTLWMHDRQIGGTNFETADVGRRRTGRFHPTAYGLTVVAGLVDIFPALIAFGELCRREGLDVDDDTPEAASATLDSFGGSAEGQRVIAAAKRIAIVVVRDFAGRQMPWESLAIIDLGLMAGMARKRKSGHGAAVARLPDFGTYFVSLTLQLGAERTLASAQHSGPQRGEPAPH